MLIEPLLRRADFLREVVADLGLDTEVVRDRAEQLEGAEVRRGDGTAVAPLDRLAGWTLPLLDGGGELLALKGATAQDELDAAAGTLARWPVEEARVLHVGIGVVDPPTTVVRVRLRAGGAR